MAKRKKTNKEKELKPHKDRLPWDHPSRGNKPRDKSLPYSEWIELNERKGKSRKRSVAEKKAQLLRELREKSRRAPSRPLETEPKRRKKIKKAAIVTAAEPKQKKRKRKKKRGFAWADYENGIYKKYRVRAVYEGGATGLVQQKRKR
jgi:hypothetical protein